MQKAPGFAVGIHAALDGKGELGHPLQLINRNPLGQVVDETLRILLRQRKVDVVFETHVSAVWLVESRQGGFFTLLRSQQANHRRIRQSLLHRAAKATRQVVWLGNIGFHAWHDCYSMIRLIAT